MEHRTCNNKVKKSVKNKTCFMLCVPCSMKQKGFTIIEIIVVLAIFFIIIAVAINLLLSVVIQQKRILAEQELLNQTSYVAEHMSKALRMATFDPDGSCLGATGNIYLLTRNNNGTQEACSNVQQDCNGIRFINQSDSNACVEFFLDGSIDPQNPRLKETRNASTPQNLLSEKFSIKYVKFVINGDKTLRVATSGGLVQPKVSILLDIKTEPSATQQEKIIQTTISQRNLNK